jgi:serine/threonine protein kinase
MGAEGTSSVRSAASACPADEVLAVHLEQELVGEEAERVAAHIDGCDACRELVVVLARQRRADLETKETSARDGVPRPAPIELSMPSLPGALAGRYQLKRLIGRGAMGAVYEALDMNLHRLVALKVLRLAPEKTADERVEAANRLVREARAMAVLSHRNVVAVYDVGQHNDQVFVAMQLIDGATLRLWLRAQKRTPRQVMRVLYDAGAGLAAAHHSRLVHRDFKPDNVLISRRGTARVTDFGLARRADLGPDPLSRSSTDADRGSRPVIVEIDAADSNDVTRTGAVVGTPAYMSPEQARGQVIDARADQFSFCVTAWEALYGQRPFAGTTWSEIYANVISGNFTAAESDSYVSRQIQRALRRGLSAEPDDRWATMGELLAEFDQVLRRPGRIQRVAAVGGIAAAASVIAVLIYNESREVMKDDGPVATPAPVAAVAPKVEPEPTPAPPTPTPTPAPEIPKKDPPRAVVKPPRPKPEQPSGATTSTGTSTAVAVEPAADTRGDQLREERAALVSHWKQRDLLPGDLPGAYGDAIREADASLASKDYDRAEAQLGKARAAVDGIVIDFAFVNRKLTRLNDRITGLPEDRRDEYAALLQSLNASVKAGNYEAANRKLNEIAARLGVEK